MPRPLHVLFALSGWLAGGCASVASTPSLASTERPEAATLTTLPARFDSLRRADRIPGLAVVILHDTTIVLAHGFGFADLESQRPVTPETPFNIASVSKPISAVVALRLAESGLLDLDRPMRQYAGFSQFC